MGMLPTGEYDKEMWKHLFIAWGGSAILKK
jgi:hypothetical protein